MHADHDPLPEPPVLADPRLDASLRRHGYVVARVLEPDDAAALRAIYGELHGWSRLEHSEHQPPDFEGDFLNDDLAYRRAAADAIDHRCSAAVNRMFPRHRPIGRSFQVKWPTLDGAPTTWCDVPTVFHADTTFVADSRRAASVMVWTALQDTSVANGAMWVVPGSHAVDRSLRGTDFMPDWLCHSEVFDRRAVAIELQAGQALVFDPALVHRSGANHTTAPRVIATTLMAAADARLGFYRRVDDHLAAIVDIDESFFSTRRVGEMDTMPSTQTVDIEGSQLGAATVAERIDRQVGGAAGVP